MSRQDGARGMAGLILLLSLVIFPVAVTAQTPFALVNIGQRIDVDDARMVGRGGWGMAVNDSLHPGFKNLAGLSSLRHVAIKFTGYGDHVTSREGAAERSTNRTISPDIRAALPVIKSRLALSAGFAVSRSNQYRTLMEETWFAWDDTLTGNEQFIREGTLWSVPLGLSLRLLPGLSVGGTLGLERGTIRESVTNFFITPSTARGVPLYLANGRTRDDEFSGTAYTLSVVLSPWKHLNLGGSWRLAHDLEVSRKVEMGGVASRYRETLTYHFPDEYRAGFDFNPGGRWHLGGDFQYMSFGDFSGRDDWAADMEDEFTIGAGLERSQQYERHGGMNNLPLRLGFQYRQWGYRVGGNPVKEKFISVGTGFPFRNRMGYLDLALSFGIIGDQADNGYESKVWRFSMSFTGLEKWW